jgi:hypothetical protein
MPVLPPSTQSLYRLFEALSRRLTDLLGVLYLQGIIERRTAMGLAEKVSDELSRIQLPTGVHRKWLKLVAFGKWKSGKSFFLSHFPPPLVAIDCGDGGISGYFPKDDPNYVCFQVTDPVRYNQAIDWALEHQDEINSVVVDPLTELWTDHLDWHQENLGVSEIKGGHWKDVKMPWRLNLARLKRGRFHLGYSTWVREVDYKEDKDDVGPGERGRLVISAQEVPQMERTVGYNIDMIFETKAVLDSLNKPTGQYEVVFWGGRIPTAVPPEMLYIGKTWRFDARKPENTWEKVIAPAMEHWADGAVDVLGLDPVEARESRHGLDVLAQDEAVGRLIRLIEAQTELKAYTEFFAQQVQPEFLMLSEDRKAKIKEAHLKKKGELEAA